MTFEEAVEICRPVLNISQSLDPAEQVHVLVKCQRGSDVWFPERWDHQANEKQTVSDIISGELTDVVEVFETGRRLPITEDVARAVADHFAQSREAVPYRIQGFLHKVLGVTSTRGLNLSEAA